MFQGGFVSWFLFYSFLPAALYSILLFLYPIKDFYVEREMDLNECRAGDSLNVTLHIRRKLPFPLFFMVVEEETPGKLKESGAAVTKEMTFPWFKKEFRVEHSFKELPRGEHDFRMVKIKVGDPLGFIEKEAAFLLKDTVLVYPSYYEISLSQFGVQRNEGQQAGTSVRMQREVSNLSGLREYQPGDRFSWINWKATARRNEIMTKEFEEQKNMDFLVLLDNSRSEGFEPAVSLTASIVHAAIKRGSPVGFFVRGLMEHPLPATGGSVQRQRILQFLAKAEPRRDSPLGAFDQKNDVIPANLGIVLVTSLVTEELINDVAKRKQSRSITIVSLRKGPALSTQEVRLQHMGALKGIPVHFLEGEFQKWTEVSGI